MDIKVLGPGCRKCQLLKKMTTKAVAETGVDATVTKVEDLTEIMKLGVMTTPALVIDGKVILKGRLPSYGEIKETLLGEAK